MEQWELKKNATHWEEMISGVIGAGLSAQDLWEAAIKYFQWCELNPLYRNEVIRSGKNTGRIIQVPIQRPYTLQALCMRIGISQAYLFDIAKSEEQNDFYFVANNIIQIVFTQKLEGALIGIYNPIISAKELMFGDPSNQNKSSVIRIEVEANAPRLLSNETEIEMPKAQSVGGQS